MFGIPDHLLRELHAVEGQIRAAFKGITREGGTSWSQAREIDRSSSLADQLRARAEDTDAAWEQLVDNPDWNHEPGIGGFAFLDPIGYRYYLAPAMIRAAREGLGESLASTLTISSDLRREQIALFTEKQSRAVVRFIRFMIAVRRHHNDDIYAQAWLEAHRSHWHKWDGWPNPID